MKWKRCFTFFTLLAAMLMLSACGISNKDLERVKQAEAKYAKAVTSIDGQEKWYNDAKKKSDFSFYAPYAKKENWEETYSQARKELGYADDYFKKEIRPILDRNKSKEANALLIHVGRYQNRIIMARDTSQKVRKRMTTLKGYESDAPAIYSKAKDSVSRIDKLRKSLADHTAAVKTTFSNRSKEIDKLILPFELKCKTAHSQFTLTENEFKKRGKGFVDYACFGKNGQLVLSTEASLKSLDRNIRKKLSELSTSYTKMISDMRTEDRPWVELTKTTWDENSDWDTEQDSIYDSKRFVSAAQFARLPEGTVIDSGYEYSIEVSDRDVDTHYFHTYTIIENGVPRKTGWIEVSEDFYEEHENDLGQEIVSKPIGYFESETITTSTPPGFSKVGDPKYGKWNDGGTPNDKSDDFWSFYGKYAFFSNLLGGNRIGYSEWNDWDRNYRGRGSYYGRDKGGKQKFGTTGSYVRTNSNYVSTSYARKGGFKQPVATARGKGTTMRNRGPGGKGK